MLICHVTQLTLGRPFIEGYIAQYRMKCSTVYINPTGNLLNEYDFLRFFS